MYRLSPSPHHAKPGRAPTRTLPARGRLLALSTGPKRGDRAVVLVVALAAVDRLQLGSVRPVFDTVETQVAADAIQIGMNAAGKPLGVDIKQYISAVSFHFKPGAGMTLKAVR